MGDPMRIILVQEFTGQKQNTRRAIFRLGLPDRADVEAALAVLVSKRTEADFQAWRDQRHGLPRSIGGSNRGERLPPDWKPPRRVAG
jgi:hypothetical protein